MRQKFEGYLKQLMAVYEKAGTPWFLTLETDLSYSAGK
jgi:hypothetical protein